MIPDLLYSGKDKTMETVKISEVSRGSREERRKDELFCMILYENMVDLCAFVRFY